MTKSYYRIPFLVWQDNSDTKDPKDQHAKVDGLIQAVNPKPNPKGRRYTEEILKMSENKEYAEMTIKDGQIVFISCFFFVI